MPPTGMWVNDFDTGTIGLIVSSVDGWAHAPSTRDKTSLLPTRVGAIILAPEAETAPRPLVIDGLIRRANQAATKAAILDLQERLYCGTVELRFADDPDKVYYARVTDGDVLAGPYQFANRDARIQIRATCHDPLIYDRYGSVVGFSSARAPVPLGSAVSAPMLIVSGTTANPAITYRDKSGTVKQTMVFTVTLGANDYLEVDCELFKVTRYTAGVASNGIALLTSGDFLRLDPHDSDPASGVWATLETNGSNLGECHYRRCWL